MHAQPASLYTCSLVQCIQYRDICDYQFIWFNAKQVTVRHRKLTWRLIFVFFQIKFQIKWNIGFEIGLATEMYNKCSHRNDIHKQSMQSLVRERERRLMYSKQYRLLCLLLALTHTCMTCQYLYLYLHRQSVCDNSTLWRLPIGNFRVTQFANVSHTPPGDWQLHQGLSICHLLRKSMLARTVRPVLMSTASTRISVSPNVILARISRRPRLRLSDDPAASLGSELTEDRWAWW